MKNNQLVKYWLKLLVIPYILFFVFLFSYYFYSKNLPFSFWDEFFWVGRSYFFEFFIKGDFNSRIWQSVQSYDQPKLAEYLYGAWLYPSYLFDKNRSTKLSSYTLFLIKNGFYEIDEFYLKSLSAKDKKSFNLIKFDEKMSGFPQEWVDKYGQESLKPINLIYKARILNLFLLSGAVIFAYFIAFKYQGVIFATIFSLFYGFNSLIIKTSLLAHSEALFLFNLNASILFMILYFTKKRKIIYLFLFSLFSGLAMSTKINGIMVVLIFFVVNSILMIGKKNYLKGLLTSFFPLVIALVIFIFLNPFTYSQPLKNIKHMFEWRQKVSVLQAQSFSQNSLFSKRSRIEKIFKNFYFSDKAPFFNGVIFFEQLIKIKKYGNYLFILFFLGLFYLLRQVFKKNLTAIIILTSFILILILMSYYLVLNWARYFVPLSLFFILFQTLGLFLIIKFLFNLLRLLISAKKILL